MPDLDPISPAQIERLYDHNPCPQSVSGHRVDSPDGRCSWCRRKVEPNDAERRANEQWHRDRRLVREPRTNPMGGSRTTNGRMRQP